MKIIVQIYILLIEKLNDQKDKAKKMSIQEKLALPSIADGEDKSCPFKNCIRNNYRHIRKWAKRSLTNCFRIYDRDIREYPLAIDYYAGQFCVHYFRQNRKDQDPPHHLYNAAVQAICSLFNVSSDSIYWRTRIKRDKKQQYEKTDSSKKFFVVFEYGIKFRVNLSDYLDTGLFLDHRETRQLVASMAQGKRVLNLFSYTCAFSIQAASRGASFTKSVDLSNTYTKWGKSNFILNKIPLEPTFLDLRMNLSEFKSLIMCMLKKLQP